MKAGYQAFRARKVDKKTKQRIEKRLKKSLLVNISGDGFDELGLTANVSRQGLLLITSNPIPSKNQLSILIAAGDELFAITGEIKWMLVNSEEPSGSSTNRIGVKIKSAPEKYIKYIDEIIKSRIFDENQPDKKR